MTAADDSRSARAAGHDDELVGIAREAIGSRFGLTPAQSARLRGATRVEIEGDAKAMRSELGLTPLDERTRDEGGRYARGDDMNSIIRAASGRR
jgi:hypothetical protein